MTPEVLTSAVCMAIGTVGLVHSIVGGRSNKTSASHGSTSSTGGALTSGTMVRRIAPALGIAILVLFTTRWPVAALLGALIGFFSPVMWGRTSAAVATDRIEAIAVWTELVRDTLAASVGLSEALMATAPVAPPPIRESAVKLADRLASGVSMADSLRLFADEVDDPSCDMVACALLLAAEARTQKLSDLLSSLAESIREEVAMRLRVEATRAASRSSVRTVITFSLVFVGALLLVARSYLEPFGTPVGQLVLASVGACYAGGIAAMLRLVRPRTPARLLGQARKNHPLAMGETR